MSANRIVTAKEFRNYFRKQVLTICDFSQEEASHCFGVGPMQMSLSKGVELVTTMKASYEATGRTLDRELVHLHTPKGSRMFVSQTLNQMALVSLVHGANAIETIWRTLGDLIVIARRGRENIYVAKAGASDMELISMMELRLGKQEATRKANEALAEVIDSGRAALVGRTIGEAYAQDCAEYFRSIPAANDQ